MYHNNTSPELRNDSLICSPRLNLIMRSTPEFIAKALLFSLVLLARINEGDFSEIYEFKVKTIRGELVDMSMYRGKVLLIVNVASECGYTDNHYRELNELYSIFRDDSFEILAFPCNQFGYQEPKRNSAIERFARQTYNAEYPLFAKIQVIGENAHPLYKWLQSQSGDEPSWNFCKYLISKEGQVVKFQPPSISPIAMFEDIESLISSGTLKDENQRVEL